MPLPRLFTLVALLTVIVSACGDSAEPPSTSTSTSISTDAAVAVPDGVVTAPNGTNAPNDPLPRAELERILTEIMAKGGVPGVSPEEAWREDR